NWAMGAAPSALPARVAGAEGGASPQPWRQSPACAVALASRGSSRQDRGRRDIGVSSGMDRPDCTRS
ncbi:hypothetical protein K4H02_23720, partial [Mycobacterium tuberculosis]|nr:hypothetical protein [Mycobacterium tuberculosis]